ncbi:MAG TPA: S1/P1 nuclease [Steroidobacteraceae bacterium]|nr:S1/P1 nuclease [Steroidobacteraceae bacterium]
MTPQLLSRLQAAKRFGVIAALCLGPCWSPLAHAWDHFGHMVLAAVAWQHLTPRTRTRAGDLLKLNPDYGRWVARVPPAQQPMIAFLRAATWADAIKHEAGYINDGERPDGAGPQPNAGYGDRREHRYWHYVDVPFSPDQTPLPAVPVPNAATQITEFRRQLAGAGRSAAQRSYDLVWLLHLVGDIHQPLHAVSRFTQALPAGDLGGNRIRLCNPPCRRELHAFWDQVPGHGTPQQALDLARRLPAPPASGVTDTRIADWVTESAELARRIAYASPIGEGEGPYALTPAYSAQARRIARARIALAGRRLAVLLNRALGR